MKKSPVFAAVMAAAGTSAAKVAAGAVIPDGDGIKRDDVSPISIKGTGTDGALMLDGMKPVNTFKKDGLVFGIFTKMRSGHHLSQSMLAARFAAKARPATGIPHPGRLT